MSNQDPLIVALDFESRDAAANLVAALGEEVSFYKVGMELYAAAGMGFVRELIDGGKKVFLDMKFYDIPETVKRAVAQVAKSGVTYLTVHGSNAVMRGAVEGRGDSALKLLAVTVLTSFDESDLKDMGYNVPVADLVTLRVHNAMVWGMDGLVASPLEARRIRAQVGPDALIVTPGVRSPGADTGDQKRIATPAQALRDGASNIVMGREITRAQDPAATVREIRAQLAAQPAAAA